MSIQNNYVAILAGGIGSRFWPESRQKLPKQFLDLLGTGQSLIQDTFNHVKGICPIDHIFVITHEAYVSHVHAHLPEVLKSNIISEPSRKNTAPSAAYITHKILALNPEANIFITPSDYIITNDRMFQTQVFEILDYVAHHNNIASIGIKPTRPDTKYGYIQYEHKNEEDIFHKVKTFVEKPNLEIARTFYALAIFYGTPVCSHGMPKLS